MTRDEIDISRRKVLAGLGGIGLASTGAGLGTSAYFSDTEEFDGNQLVAGSLDMKVSYEEHYSDWSDDELDGIPEGDLTMEQPNDLQSFTGIIGDDVGPVWVHNDSVDQFMDNTEVTGPNKPLELGETPCDPVGATANDDPAASIDLGDVKPGDFGEVTFDYYLCGNPGYLWMAGNLASASENGLTEPESKDPDEEEGVVELLDEVQTRLWYDENCDNIPQLETQPACVDLIIDTSGTMEENVYANGEPSIGKADAAQEIGSDIVTTLDGLDGNDDGVLGPGPLGSPDNFLVSVNSFSDGSSLVQDLTDDEQLVLDALQTARDDTPAGNTNVAGALDLSRQELADCPHDDAYAVLFTNNPPTDSSVRADITTEADELKAAGITLKIVALDVDPDSSQGAFWESVASDPDDVFFVFQEPDGAGSSSGGSADVQGEIAQAASGVIGQLGAGGSEQILFEGTLRETMIALEEGNGLELDADRGTVGRQCYDPGQRYCIGFAWWLPVNHANEIQTDSATFDLGFYTEQCRHNDGSGMEPEETATQTPGGT
jgi:predicted ribosomally synthesized peptide with SipW-like signal peptide